MITTEQLEHRKNTIGSSDTPAIFGLYPDSFARNAFTIWAEKTDNVDPFKGNHATDAGNFLEPAVLDWGLREVGAIDFVKSPPTITHPLHAWMTCNLDCWFRKVNDPSQMILEAKTTGIVGWNGKDAWENGVPEYVQVQVQHQLAVTGWQRAYVAALIGGAGFRLYVINRDEELIAFMIRELELFWRNYVQTENPPPTRPFTEVSKRLRRREGVEVTIPADVAHAHVEAKRRLEEAQEREDEARRDLLASMKDAEVGLYAGGGRVTFFANVKGVRSLRHTSIGQPNAELLESMAAESNRMLQQLESGT